MRQFSLKCGNVYDERFFAIQVADSLRSARAIARIACQLFEPTSVVDVGCGQGAWLAAFAELGLTQLRGIDGDYVNGDKLLFDRADFTAADLRGTFEIPGRYDLAICVEVAEHLPGSCSRQLVHAVTQASPVVLFSAAVPGQGGSGHINEQWPSYWRSLFAAEGFRMFDPIRPRIREENAICWWYRQNLVVFASREAISRHSRLGEEVAGDDIEWVHISLVRRKHNLRSSLLRVPGAMWAWSRIKPWVRSHMTSPDSPIACGNAVDDSL
ncbi:MAG: class I SAM-dependent methyltransferase [Candidatus Binataceae bacterium]